MGPSVGPIARLKQENRDLEAEVEQLKKELELFHDVDDENRDLKARVEGLELEMGRRHRVDTDTIERLKAEVENLRELQVAAEAIEGPASWFAPVLLGPVRKLHKAIRKVRGME